MTFYIPPVFLFGNKVRHIRNNQERNKTEYKTVTETEIQIENRNIKRIEELEEENRTLKDKIEFLTNCLDDRDKSIELMKEGNKKLKEENNELKEKIKNMEKAEKRFFELMKNYVMNKKD